MLERRDERVTLMAQALNAIRVVKYFAWEKSVERDALAVRELELSARRRLAIAETVTTLAYVATSTLVLFAALGAYVALGGRLEAATIFASVALFGALEEPVGSLSRIISRWTNALVSADRVVGFLRQEELVDRPFASSSGLAPAVEAKGLSTRYTGSARQSLRAIELRVEPGESIAVVGPVGAGKSTLLYALLGEVLPEAGQIAYLAANGASQPRPRTAYVPQEAYIVNGSLRENIVFGAESDCLAGLASAEVERELARAVEVACLEADVARLPAGLDTEIGESGVNLSGGQKQRASLARAALFRPELVLLDDPLSAVDVDTEASLCDRLLFGAWAGRTRIVVTHRLAHLARFDRVAFLREGRLVACAPFAQLLAASPEFCAFFAEQAKSEGASIRPEVDEGRAPAAAPPATRAGPGAGPATVAEAQAWRARARITEDEERETGAVKGSVYRQYLNALGGSDARWRALRLFGLGFGTLAVILLPFAQRAWLAASSNFQAAGARQAASVAGERLSLALAGLGLDEWASSPKWSILVYGVLCAVSLLAVLANRLFWLERGMGAGREMHDAMLKSALAAPLRFFDSTPAGRVLQRFSRDLESIDIQLQGSFESMLRCAAQVVASLLLIAASLPATLLAIAPTLWLYYVAQDRYRRPAREAKRLDSINRSPRYAHFKETLQGLSVIRAYNRSDWFMEQFFLRLERSQKMFRGHYMLNRWFSSRIPLLGGAISFATATGLAISAHKGGVSAGLAGLVATSAIGIWDYLNWGIRIFAEVEARMTSVERINRYSSLAPERDVARLPAARLSQNWPERGEVVFAGAVARYAPHLPAALRGVDFVVPAGSRVGLIGRTGAGKSTIFQALFRCVELESGLIEIDGVDIATVPLERLRRSIAIIPQDPALFRGTLRENLDRYGERSDAEIERALRLARMWEAALALPHGSFSAWLERF
jgi:ABC-type multidrug transport system fused ATPase/permease subunit